MSNYNIVVIISIVICAIISLLISYYGTLVILQQDSGLFKIVQLVVAIMVMMGFYSPIKYLLLKYMDIDINEDNNDVK
ncbi:MAG: hypothetical protein ACQERD_04475 [Campylobacterota bacterium]